MPLFKITKNHIGKRADERWTVKSTTGEVLKRNKNLKNLLNYFNQKKLNIVK